MEGQTNDLRCRKRDDKKKIDPNFFHLPELITTYNPIVILTPFKAKKKYNFEDFMSNEL